MCRSKGYLRATAIIQAETALVYTRVVEVEVMQSDTNLIYSEVKKTGFGV